MKTIKHKFMAVLLCCLLAASALLATVAAFPVTTEAAEINHYSFYSTNAYMTGVCKEGEKPSGDVVIPATFTYKGVKYTVTEICMNAFSGNTKVTSVTIPSTVQTIGVGAFNGCTKLKSVTISKKAELSSIGRYAFSDCTALKEISINAETVGGYAFKNCTKLSKVTFGDRVKEIGEWAFSGTAVKSITFGKNITTIGDYALRDCSKLEKIVIGENVTTLGGHVVVGGAVSDGCRKLKKITIKSTKLKFENCGDAGSAPFGYLSEDVKITVPDGKSEEYGFLWTDDWVDEDGYVRFAITNNNAYMTGICKEGKKPSGAVKIPATFTYDGVNYKVTKTECFDDNKKITSVEIPSTVTEIGGFSGCSKLKTVTISKKANLRLIEGGAFSNCTSLKEIYIDAETVGADAFSDCSSLAKVTFGDNVKVIGEAAFLRTAIKSINFGKNITTIGASAVMECSKLENITIGANVTAIGGYIDAFSFNVKTITIKSTKLKRENCGGYGGSIGSEYREPFSGHSGNVTVKVPKSKLKAYKKFLVNTDNGRKITYKTF
jgi:hypothetical protein